MLSIQIKPLPLVEGKFVRQGTEETLAQSPDKHTKINNKKSDFNGNSGN